MLFWIIRWNFSENANSVSEIFLVFFCGRSSFENFSGNLKKFLFHEKVEFFLKKGLLDGVLCGKKMFLMLRNCIYYIVHKHMNKVIFLGIVIFFLAGTIFFVYENTQEETISQEVSMQDQTGDLSVVTTLFPLYDFSRAIGGERISVSLLLPPGVESHSFEPTPSDIVAISSSDVFVFTGEVMELWAKDILSGIQGSDVRVVDSSAGRELMSVEDHDHADEATDAHESEEVAEDERHDEHHDEHNQGDPHIWLDFDHAQAMVETIAKAFAEKDPENAELYRENARTYQQKLLAMDERYRSSLASCASRTIVYGGHYAFGYLAHRYDLEYVSAQGFSPDAEPSVKDIAFLTEQVKKESVGAVFSEELASPKIAETIAREAGARVLLLNAAHNISREDIHRGVSFLSIMEENLENLTRGLGCSS